MAETIIIEISKCFEGTAKLSEIESYINRIISFAGEGNEIILTGPGPVWLYLAAAHALHGKARKLIYCSPVTGEVVIFDHDPS